MTQAHLFLNSQFKEQSENQNLGDGADEIMRHLKLKNVKLSQRVKFLWMGLHHHIGWIEIQMEVV